MKKLVKPALLGLSMILVCAIACKKPDDSQAGTPESKTPTSYLLKWGSGSDQLYCKFDADLKLVTYRNTFAQSNGDTAVQEIAFHYFKEKLIRDYFRDGVITNSDTVMLNNDGLIEAIKYGDDSLHIKYSNGLMVETNTRDGGDLTTFKLTYDGKDVVRQEVYIDSTFEAAFVYEYYKDKLDKLRIGTLLDEDDAPNAWRVLAPVYGHPNEHLLKGYSLYEGSTLVESYQITYEFDEFNNPIKIIGTDGQTTLVLATITYTY
jgi:hypothetical protein